MKQLLPRICFFGCGFIAHRHAKILKKLYPRIELTFASREVSEAKQLAEKIKGSDYFSSCEEAAASDSVDIVFITTPHACHAELAVLAAGKKKDIIIEKPVTRTMKELDSIV